MASLDVKNPQLIAFKVSSLLLLFYLTLFFLSGLALWQAELNILLHCVGSLMLLVYGLYLVFRYCLLIHPLSVIGLSYQSSNNSWCAHLCNEQVVSVAISSTTIVTRYWVLLRMRSPTTYHYAMIVSDSLATDLFRKLRMYLLRC